MKRKELEDLGISKEQIDSVLDMHHAEMTQAKEELQKTQDDLKVAQKKVSTTEAALKKLEGVDAESLTAQIAELQEALKKKEDEHAAELADRDFQATLKDSISAANGKDAERIMKLLDIDTLKASKNQKEDIAAAIKAMKEDEITKGMFGEPEAAPVGKGNLIGSVGKTPGNAEDAAMRAAMGLPPVAEKN